jgi:lia operon protein LiaG
MNRIRQVLQIAAPSGGRRAVIARAATACAVVLLAALPAGLLAQERFSLAGDAAIFNLAGEVVIEAGTGADVVVEVTRGGRDADRLELGELNIEGWHALRIQYPEDRIVYPALGRRSSTQFTIRDDGIFGGRFVDNDFSSALGQLLAAIGVGGDHRRVSIRGSGSGMEAWADLRVQVPAGRTVSINLGTGDLRAENVDGELYLHARSGTVATRDTRGSLDIDTGSGSVAVDGAEGDVYVDTGSGGVRVGRVAGGDLTVDTGSGSVTASDVEAGYVEIDTGSGSIQVDRVSATRFEGDTGSGRIGLTDARLEDLTLDTGSGSISVGLLAEPRNVEIDTGSGGVTLTVPSSLSADLELDTGSGGVSVDVPITIHEKRRNYLRATAGEGGGLIRVDSGSGGIRIRAN